MSGVLLRELEILHRLPRALGGPAQAAELIRTAQWAGRRVCVLTGLDLHPGSVKLVPPANPYERLPELAAGARTLYLGLFENPIPEMPGQPPNLSLLQATPEELARAVGEPFAVEAVVMGGIRAEEIGIGQLVSLRRLLLEGGLLSLYLFSGSRSQANSQLRARIPRAAFGLSISNEALGRDHPASPLTRWPFPLQALVTARAQGYKPFDIDLGDPLVRGIHETLGEAVMAMATRFLRGSPDRVSRGALVAEIGRQTGLAPTTVSSRYRATVTAALWSVPASVDHATLTSLRETLPFDLLMIRAAGVEPPFDYLPSGEQDLRLEGIVGEWIAGLGQEPKPMEILPALRAFLMARGIHLTEPQVRGQLPRHAKTLWRAVAAGRLPAPFLERVVVVPKPPFDLERLEPVLPVDKVVPFLRFARGNSGVLSVMLGLGARGPMNLKVPAILGDLRRFLADPRRARFITLGIREGDLRPIPEQPARLVLAPAAILGWKDLAGGGFADEAVSLGALAADDFTDTLFGWLYRNLRAEAALSLWLREDRDSEEVLELAHRAGQAGFAEPQFLKIDGTDEMNPLPSATVTPLQTYFSARIPG